MKIGASTDLPGFAESMVDRIRAAHQAGRKDEVATAGVGEPTRPGEPQPEKTEVRRKLEVLVQEVIAGTKGSEEVIREALEAVVASGLEGELSCPGVEAEVLAAMCSDPTVVREVDGILQAVAGEMVHR